MMFIFFMGLSCHDDPVPDPNPIPEGVVLDSNSQIWIFPPTRNRHEYSNPIPEKLQKAKSLSLQNKHKEAIVELITQLKDSPQDTRIHSMLCASYLQMNDTKQSFLACQHAVKLEQTATHHANLATVYMAMGQEDNAIQSNKKALALDSVYIPAYRNLSTLQFKAGQYEDAARTLLRLMQLKPFDNYAYIAYANTQLELGNTVEAEEVLRYRISNWENEEMPDPPERLHSEIPMLLAEIIILKRDFSNALYFIDMMEESASQNSEDHDLVVWSWRLRAHVLQEMDDALAEQWKKKVHVYCQQHPLPLCLEEMRFEW